MNEEKPFVVKKASVILVILFTILTSGIYYCAWFLIRRKSLNELSQHRKLGVGIFIFCILIVCGQFILSCGSGVLAGIAEGLSDPSYSEYIPMIDAICTGLNLLLGLLCLIQCFKVKGILDDYLKSNNRFAPDLSGLATWLFGVYYLQYQINRIHKDALNKSHKATLVSAGEPVAVPVQADLS